MDDKGRISDKVPVALHERSPYYVGTKHLVEGLMACRWAPADAFVTNGSATARDGESVP